MQTFKDTVLFLGAGFSKASGLKTTREVEKSFLKLGPTNATQDPKLQDEISALLRRYWHDVFLSTSRRDPPSLEDHFTLLDLAANTGHNLGPYTPGKLRAIRRLSIHRIFDILDRGFKPSIAAKELVAAAGRGTGNAIITTNWDTSIERYLLNRGGSYSYGLRAHHIDGELFANSGVPLLKLHGSSNWMYCDCCRRIYVGAPGGGKAALHSWTFLRFEDFETLGAKRPKEYFKSQRNHLTCSFCDVELSARVATFSFTKALGFFQFKAVWDGAIDALRRAERWIFIGYSLPQADFEIRALLKTAQLADANQGRKEIIAVPGKNPLARENYERFFGTNVRVFRSYLDTWLKKQKMV
jgi:NAD-dependent SIR2 family protein deacetylase